MKPAPSNPLQSTTEAATSWADVAQVSAERDVQPDVQEHARSEVFTPEFPGGTELQAGDTVLHQKFGRCTVHRIVNGFVHMAPENERVIKLSQTIVTFTPAFVEDGRRVFSTSKRQ